MTTRFLVFTEANFMTKEMLYPMLDFAYGWELVEAGPHDLGDYVETWRCEVRDEDAFVRYLSAFPQVLHLEEEQT